MLQIEIGFIEGVVRAKRPQRLPVVLTQAEVKRRVAHLDRVYWLVGMILYGGGRC